MIVYLSTERKSSSHLKFTSEGQSKVKKDETKISESHEFLL